MYTGINTMNKNSTDHIIPKSSKEDEFAAERKKDHIDLAFQSQIGLAALDSRFSYEPILAAHPKEKSWPAFTFLDKSFQIPLWVSSMTGGTKEANRINHNLARACGEFGMGMGLGSCRSLLYSDEYFEDFNVRPLIGDQQVLYANLGIAQVEQLIFENELFRVKELLEKLQADGLIIHVNPFQEWLQPEGDLIQQSPLKTITTFMEKVDVSVIVKEVGQGMGYESLKALFQLPLEAIDFAASGGTNFAQLELLRSDPDRQAAYGILAHIGHSAIEMTEYTNQIIDELGEEVRCKQVIISGGIKNFLDGYYLINKLAVPGIYGQASAFLKHARGTYEELRTYVQTQVKGLELSKAFLTVKSDK